MRNHFLRAATDTGGGTPPVSNAWDLDYAEFTGTPQNYLYVGVQDLIPTGVFFKSDGTKLYVVGNGSDSIHEYNLSTAWDVSTASLNQSFSVSTEDTAPTDLFFKNDGTKMYILGDTGNDVNEYNLSSAWDVSTASYVQNFSIGTQDSSPTSLFFKNDGTKMYMLGNTYDFLREYNLSTAWDISTASFNQSFSVSTEDSNPTGAFFKGDGTKMYITGYSRDRINEYSLSTAWDISTASYVRNVLVSSQDAAPRGVFFKDDGTKMYMIGSSSDAVYQYSLSTAWDVSTASFTYPSSDYFSVSTQETSPSGLFLKSDGTKMYVIGSGGDDVNEYTLSTAWDVSTASYVQNFSVVAYETSTTAVFFKDDGTKMYVTGTAGDSIDEFNLSTAWDVSTASFNQTRNLSTYESAPTGIYFRDDGKKLYMVGSGGDEVNEFNLTTAWDISTSSHVQLFSVASEGNAPGGLFFKDDGTRMYVSNTVNEVIDQYNLSTAWDVSTASYDLSFPVGVYDTNVRSLFFKPDGTEFFLTGTQNDAVWAFSIS